MRQQIAQPASQPEPMPLKTKLRIVAIFVLMAAVLVGLPLIFLTLPDPQPVKVPGLAGEVSGTYVVLTDGSTYKLYPYTATLFDFPGDALVVTEARPVIAVKYRQLDENLDRYQLQASGVGQVIDTHKVVNAADKTLLIQPEQPLASGNYIFIASKDSADAGSNYFYFQVSPQ